MSVEAPRRPSIVHRLEYAAVLGVRAVAGTLPYRLAMLAGAVLGRFVHAVDRGHRRLAVANIAAAFPGRSPREHRALARAVFVHFGRLLFEILRFSRMDPAGIRQAVEFEGAEHAVQARAQGRGVLFVTGHFGFWELHALAHGATLFPIALVARALDNPLLHDLLERVRTSTGNTVIYRHRGLRRILRTLADRGGVAILIDQHIIQAQDAVVVDFFDRAATTTSAVAALALKTGAPIVPVFALPLGGGRYRMIYERPIEPPADSADPVREFTQRCTDVLEMYVRRYPEQWLWMHRRWRTPRTPGHGNGPGTGTEN